MEEEGNAENDENADNMENENKKGANEEMQEENKEEAEEDEDKKKEIEAEKLRKQIKMQKELEQFLNSDVGIYKKGCFVKIEVANIKTQHLKNFDPHFPLILCYINPTEDNFGFLKVCTAALWFCYCDTTIDEIKKAQMILQYFEDK